MRSAILLTMLFLLNLVQAQDSTYQFTTSDGVTLYLRTAGHGQPCLFIHGGPGNTSFYFEGLPVARLMEQKVRMIYYDQRGGGRSASATDSNYTIKRMELDIEEIRNFLKIKKWSAIAHSFGGLILTAYAKDYPQNIQSMVYAHCATDINSVLQSHIHNGIRMLKEIGVSYQPDTLLPLFNQMMAVHAETAKYGIEYKFMFRSAKDKNLDDSLIGAATPHFNQDFQRFVWTMKDYRINYADYTTDITLPVLIISGKKDWAVGPDAYKSWHFRNSQLLVYDFAHFSFQEEPEWFASHVLEFFQHHQ